MSRQTMKPDTVGVRIIFMGVIQRQTPGTLKLPAAGSWLCSVMWACVLITSPPICTYTHTQHVCTTHTRIHTAYPCIHTCLHTYHVFIPHTDTCIHTYHIHTHTAHTYTHTLLHKHTHAHTHTAGSHHTYRHIHCTYHSHIHTFRITL